MIDINALIEEANKIEPLPTTVLSLMRLTNNDKWSWKEVVAVIKLDPMMASRVLRIANSAAYRGKSVIIRIEDAAMKLGISNIWSIAIATNVRGLMNDAIPEFGMAEGKLWRHSIAASLVPDLLNSMFRLRIPDEAQAAALLHDIGKIVMCRMLHSIEAEVFSKARAATHDIYLAEREVFQVTHAEVSGLITQRWNLPQAIVNAIINHPRPSEEHGPACDAVYLANRIARRCLEEDDAFQFSDLDEGVCQRLGLDEASFQSITDAVNERIDEVLTDYAP